MLEFPMALCIADAVARPTASATQAASCGSQHRGTSRCLRETPGYHWASGELWNPLELCGCAFSLFRTQFGAAMEKPFVDACDPEPCNDNGERLSAAMKVDEVITWYPCGYTWRSAKGHTSRIDFVLHDASRGEELKKKKLSHRPHRGFGMQCCIRTSMCKVLQKMRLALRKTKERKNTSTSTHFRRKIRICAWRFKEDLRKFAQQPGNSVSSHAEELSIFLLQRDGSLDNRGSHRALGAQ